MPSSKDKAIPHNSKCRSRRSGAYAARRELCGVAINKFKEVYDK